MEIKKYCAGDEIEHKGRKYTLLKREPYVRVSDGRESELLWWRATCDACGSEFYRKSGPEPALVNLAIANCPKHRGVRTKRQREALRESNKRRNKVRAAMKGLL